MGDKVTLLVGPACTRFEVDVGVARRSETLANLLDDLGTDESIPVPSVTAETMARVVDWCSRTADTSEWHDAWVADMAQSDMFDLMLAANYLNVKPLFDALCETVAGMMRGKTPEAIRETFGIVNDFTPEEEAEARREHAWAMIE